MFAANAIGAVTAALILITSFDACAYTIHWRLDNPFRVLEGRDAEANFRNDLNLYLRCASVVRRKASECRDLTFAGNAYPSMKPCKDVWDCHYPTLWEGPSFRYRNLHDPARGIIVSLHPPLNGQECIWTLKLADGSQQEKIGPCNRTYLTAGLGENEVGVQVRNASARLAGNLPKTPQKIAINDLFVLVFGDSFMSGEGNPHVMQRPPFSEGDTGARTPHWWDYRCHRSLLASPSLAAAEFTRLYPQISVTLVSFACSGAEATEGVLSPYIGRESSEQALMLLQVFNPLRGVLPALGSHGILASEYLPAQYESALDALCLDPGRDGKKITDPCDRRRTADIVVLGVGVNDLGFSQILADLAKKVGPENLNEIKETVQVKLNKLKHERHKSLAPKLNDLVSWKADKGPRPVLFVEYPDPTKDEKGKYCNDVDRDRHYRSKFNATKARYGDALRSTGSRPFLPEPASLVGYGLDRVETEFAYNEIVVRLNEVVEEVSAEYQWRHVGGIAAATRTKGYCSNRTWFNSYWDSFSKQHMVQPFKHPKHGPIGGVPSGAMHPNVFAHKHISHLLVSEFESIAKERGLMK